MRAFIFGPKNGGDGIYTLVTEDGEALCSNMCSSSVYSMGDLYSNRPERKEMFEAKNITSVMFLEESDVSRDELLERNKKFKEKKTR